MIISRMIFGVMCILAVFISLIPLPNDIMAQDFNCGKELNGVVFDPLENEKNFSMNGYESSEKDGSFLQTGSTVYFCSEADCSTITVVFSGQTLSNYLNGCSNVVYVTGVPAGTYSYTASGCGGDWGATVTVNGYSDVTRVLCPTGDFGCCTGSGCGGGGSFACGTCQTIPTTTTSSVSGGVRIVSHMITKDPKPNSNCSTPIRSDTFYYYDEAAHCWLSWQNSDGNDEISCKWYKPDGELYYEHTTQTEYTNGCWYPSIYISDNPPAYISGNWRVDVSLNGVNKFNEYFTIEGLPPTTTTSSTTTILTTTTTTTTPSFCPMTVIYGGQSDEANALRWYRDNILSQTPEGRELIKLYYLWTPVIVKAMEQDEEFKAEIKQMIDGVLPMIGDVSR